MIGKLVRRRPIVEMNLIPLIDVSLILVIIFMILTPVLIQSQLTVKLPSSAEGAPAPAESTLHIQINREGAITLDGKAIRLSGLERELSLRLAKSAQKTVLVQADRTVTIEKIVAVLDIAKRLKVGKLGIGVSPPS